MSALNIAWKDLQLIFKDRGNLVFLFLLPIGFIMLFAILGKAANIGGRPEEQGVQLVIVNQDTEGEAAVQFIQSLEKSHKLAVEYFDLSKAEAQLSEAIIGWYLLVPPDFSSQVAARRQALVTLVLHPNHNVVHVETIERVLQTAIREFAFMQSLYNSLDQMRQMQAANPEATNFFSVERIEQQISEQKARAEERPLVVVKQTVPAGLEGGEEKEPDFAHGTVVGFATLFVFLSAQSAAQSLFDEKRTGSFRRLLAAPISKASLLLGKMLPNLLISLLQIGVIFLTGIFLLPLVGVNPLDLSSDPLGLALVAFLLALCSTSLGIFITSLVQTESQVGALASGVLWIAGFVGGSIIPLYVLPDLFSKIGIVIPHYWANTALNTLLLRGGALGEIQEPVLALLGFSVGFFLVGLWRFDFD